jgi:GT2 family glycosyltransferase
LPFPKVTVAVPTLAADEALDQCLKTLEAQNFSDFEIVVIDNSAGNRAPSPGGRVRVIRNSANVGFGAAINQAFRISEAPYLATLNDDTAADPGWLAALVTEAEAHPECGLFASQVRLARTGLLDSAGMLIARDGSSKQRGHGQPPDLYASVRDALLPSGSAALYRRSMLEEIGLFDETFFLYCEDTDLGLRARWAKWGCRYVAGAVVEHRYSHSAGQASPLKAYYVERNRLYTVLKNFPLRMLWMVPFAAAARYVWHLHALLTGRGKGSEYRDSGHNAWLLPWLVLRAHAATLRRLSLLLAERRLIHTQRRITTGEFRSLLEEHSISLSQVASL